MRIFPWRFAPFLAQAKILIDPLRLILPAFLSPQARTRVARPPITEWGSFMGTRSNIGIQNLDGSYDVIYCHWDGYPSHNGRILYEHYQDLKKIKRLIALGDISILAPEIGKRHCFEKRSGGKANEAYRRKHEHMCLAYGRDRGEKDTQARHYANYDELCKMLEEAWTEWVYMYRLNDRLWYYTNNPSPTWFMSCGTEQMQTSRLTPQAWQNKVA